MKKKSNKSIIIFITTLFVSVVYLSSLYLPKVANASSLSSSTGFISAAFSSLSSSEKRSSDTAFLSALSSLKNIKIDTSLFSDKSFMSLKNNAVKIDSITPGRVNPFSPFGSSTKNVDIASTPKIITEKASAVTDKTAVLNGTINVASDVANAYFEYGTTLNLGVVTPTIQTSLVGSFVKNILGLTPKTEYFYRACAKINNIANCGEVVTFTTN